jgi:hypothetical protein
MIYIERELDRIGRTLRNTQSGARYDELYAAQQALEWALDPASCAAPLDMIERQPRNRLISTTSAKEDCPA